MKDGSLGITLSETKPSPVQPTWSQTPDNCWGQEEGVAPSPKQSSDPADSARQLIDAATTTHMAEVKVEGP